MVLGSIYERKGATGAGQMGALLMGRLINACIIGIAKTASKQGAATPGCLDATRKCTLLFSEGEFSECLPVAIVVVASSACSGLCNSEPH